MTSEHEDRKGWTSRRHLLRKLGIIMIPVTAIGGAFGTGTAYGFEGHGGGTDRQSPPKQSKLFAKYQEQPKDGQSCAHCIFFRPGPSSGAMGSCGIVSGTISPNGWCRLFVLQQAPQFPGERG